MGDDYRLNNKDVGKKGALSLYSTPARLATREMNMLVEAWHTLHSAKRAMIAAYEIHAAQDVPILEYFGKIQIPF